MVQCDVDCFTEPFDARSHPSRSSRAVRMFPASSLGPTFTPAAYDAILYTVGATPDAGYRLARTYPGIVFLHDLALVDSELVRRARGIIVSSPSARRMIREDLELRSGSTPIWVVPLPASDSSRASVGRDNEQLVSFDEVARRVLEIADLDLEPSHPSEESALVSLPAA